MYVLYLLVMVGDELWEELLLKAESAGAILEVKRSYDVFGVKMNRVDVADVEWMDVDVDVGVQEVNLAIVVSVVIAIDCVVNAFVVAVEVVVTEVVMMVGVVVDCMSKRGVSEI